MKCPCCGKECISVMVHVSKSEDEKHRIWLEEFDHKFIGFIDPFLETHMQIEINDLAEIEFPMLSKVTIANRIRNRIKELGLNPRKALGIKRRGKDNPVHNHGVIERISKSVRDLWDDGNYADRINGMMGTKGQDHPQFGKGIKGELNPNYNPENHTLEKEGEFRFSAFLKNFQNIETCSRCGSTENKINVHHVDEDHKNFLPSNLEVLCVPCHMAFHYNNRKCPFVTIGKDFWFAASHQLPNHLGNCQYLHGHEWKFSIEVRKRIDPDTGMVMDFSELKKIVNDSIVSKLDHSLLNEELYNPTAENILVWIWERLMFDGLLKGIYKITLWESKDSYAILDTDGMLSVFKDGEYLKRNK